jgi:hypothetical protein
LVKEPDQLPLLNEEFIFDPIKEQFVKDAEFAEIPETIDQASNNIPAIIQEIEALKNSKIISQLHSDLEKRCEYLPGPNTNIVLLPMNPDMKGMYVKYSLDFMYTGVTAITPGSGLIISSIDPLEKGREKRKESLIYQPM